MNIPFRPKILALSLACLGSGLGAFPVWADTLAGGASITHGNVLNPPGAGAERDDPAALGLYRIPVSHTPTGFMYDYARYRTGEEDEASVTTEGWTHRTVLEAGFVGGEGNNKASQFRQYKDVRNGPLLNYLGYEAEKASEARYINIYASGVGRRDAYYGMNFGRYNDFRLSLSYDTILHTYTNARTIWQGVGTDHLGLPAGFSPAGTSFTDPVAMAALNDAVNKAPETTLEVVRKKAALRADWRMNDFWKGYTSYSLEKRDGTRQTSGAFWFPLSIPGYSLFPSPANIVSGSVTQLVEPIDYQTHDLVTGLEYADDLTQVNLSVGASFFRNANRSLTWENPFNLSSLGTALSFGAMPNTASDLKYGQFALAPDNEAYNVKGEFARAFPEFYRANLSGTVSLTRMRQNDKLIAPTPNSGYGGAIDLPPAYGGTGLSFIYPYSNWNTTAALSQQSTEAAIDTKLIDLNLSLVPVDKLTLRSKLRYYETANKTRYVAYNPLTGQYGYLQMGGGHGTFIATQDGIFYPGISTVSAVGNTAQAFQYRNIPFDGHQLNASLEGDYRLTTKATLNFGYEREDIHRNYREREETWEDKLKIGLIYREPDLGTLRMSYRYADRRGGAYNSNPYIQFNTMSLPGYVGPEWPFTLAEFRMMDLVDRRQHTFNSRLNAMLRPDLDAGITFQYKLNEYPTSTYGRTGRQPATSINLDLNYAPAPEFTAYAFYSHEQSHLKQTGIAGTTLNDPATNAFWADPSDHAGGNIYPYTNAWSVTNKDRSDVLGLGVTRTEGRFVWDGRYSIARNVNSVNYSYATSGGAVLGNPYLSYDMGSSFPDTTYLQQTLETSVTVKLAKDLSTRLFYRYEKYHINDWHYQSLGENLMVPSNNGMGSNGVIFLDPGQKDARVDVIGLMLQYRL